MIKLKWNKLDSKTKTQLKSIRPLVMLLGGIELTENAFTDFVKQYVTHGSTLILGILSNNDIPGLEGSEHFTSLAQSQAEILISNVVKQGVIEANKIALLIHDSTEVKYIIRELIPDQIFRVRGSWANVLHYQKEFWEAYDLEKKIQLISPYSTEAEAKQNSCKVYTKELEDFETKFKKELSGRIDVSQEIIAEILTNIVKLSWDWTGRTGALITENNRIVSWGENRVLGYPGYMLHKGAAREIRKAPIGENIEFGETVHAEQEAILKAIGKIKSFDDCVLYTSKFLCPICSRIVGASGIKKVIYVDEYTNEIGYRQMEVCGIEVGRMTMNNEQ